jgi:subtilase family serine protease
VAPADNPVPTLTSLTPSGAAAGSPGFTLVVDGADFVDGAVVRWNGSPRSTTFVDAGRLTASIAAADIAVAGSASVSVVNPAPGGGPSPAALTFTIAPGGPDLVAISVTNPPGAAAPGTAFAVTDSLKNQGTAGAGASTTRFYLSLDGARGPGDLLLAGSRSVSALAAGATSSGTVTVTIPAATALATYRLLACDDDTGAVTESSEGNNCVAAAGSVTVARPDLVETTLDDPPASVVPGAKFAVKGTTKNQGAVSAAASTTRFYLSLDGAKGSGDRLLSGTRSVPILAAGALVVKTVTVTVPSSTPLGTYTLLACADDGLRVTEANETNNCRPSATRVVVGRPDLVETAVSNPPAAAAAGTAFAVTDTARNDGTAPATVSTTRYYLSLDGTKNSGDRLLTGTRAVPSLAPGALSTGTVTVTIPSTTPAAPYFLLACADDLARVVEIGGSNNCRPSATKVVVGP